MKNSISILGSGWLGLALAKSLQQNNKQIKLSTRSPDKIATISDSNISAYLVDIERLTESASAFLQSQTLIINITCKVKEAYQELIEAIQVSPIKQVLFISSTSVYPMQNGICNESDQLSLDTPLREIEKLFTENTHFQTTILRFAGLVGPKRHPGRFFATGKKVRDANAKVNLIHLDDCIGIITAILEQQAWGQIFNGCADNHPSKKAYYSEMAKQLGYPEPDCLEPEVSATKEVSNQKVKSVLGYQFSYPDVYHFQY